MFMIFGPVKNPSRILLKIYNIIVINNGKGKNNKPNMLDIFNIVISMLKFNINNNIYSKAEI